METTLFKMPLYLPAQGATEIEATVIEWYVAEGDHFDKGQSLVQVDSAKSIFDFEAPCDGLVIRRLHLEGDTLPLTNPIVEIETDDPAMRDWIPPVAAGEPPIVHQRTEPNTNATNRLGQPTTFLGFGGYLPKRVILPGGRGYRLTFLQNQRWPISAANWRLGFLISPHWHRAY